MLDVKQKRRIYDITNVLEGIGLIEKETKNTIKWKWVDYTAESFYETMYNKFEWRCNYMNINYGEGSR